jgi:CheY-like chemotaxis protein
MAGIFPGASVLFVDDEQPIRLLFGRALIAAGFDFHEASDGNQALAQVDQRHHDAIVIDMIMPDREGVETIIEIRKRRPDAFIIAMSGGGRIGPADFLNLASALGADRTLSKPFTPAQLIEELAAGPSPKKSG